MKMPKISVLASETSWYFRELNRAAERKGAAIDRISFANLATVFGDQIPGSIGEVDPIENSWKPPAPVALVRTMPLGSLEQVIFRMDVLRAWESAGIKVVNSAQCLEISIDKLLTLDHFNRNNVPFPTTYCCQTTEQALEAFELLDHDVVVKPIFGGEGRGIVRIKEPEVAYRVFKSLEYSRSVIYCQKFVRQVSKEIRILFIGDKYFSVTKSSNNSWIRNASQGGTASIYKPTEDELELARRATNSVSGQLVGIDIVEQSDGQKLVLEVNAVPGWQLLQKVTGTCIADEVIEWAISKISS